MNEFMGSTLSIFAQTILHELDSYVEAKHLTKDQKMEITGHLNAEAFKFALHVKEQLDNVCFPLLHSHNI